MKRVWANGKKGVTLVELIAVMAIMTVIIGAASIALFGGARSTTDGSADYTNHSDAYLLEVWLRKNLPTAVSLDKNNVAEKPSGSCTEVLNLYFDSGGDFIVGKNGTESVMYLSNIKQVVLKTVDAGSNEELHYEITATESSRSFTLSGGIVLNNIKSGTSSVDFIMSAGTSIYVNIAK